MDRIHFSEIIEDLRHIKWATSLEPEAGLYILCGEFALIGYRAKKNIKPRSISELTILAEHTYKQLAKSQESRPSGKDVLASLHLFDDPTNPIIQEIDWDNEIIYWRTMKGAEPKTGFKQFYNKLSKIRKSVSG